MGTHLPLAPYVNRGKVIIAEKKMQNEKEKEKIKGFNEGVRFTVAKTPNMLFFSKTK